MGKRQLVKRTFIIKRNLRMRQKRKHLLIATHSGLLICVKN